jgi:hypothetical protein
MFWDDFIIENGKSYGDAMGCGMGLGKRKKRRSTVCGGAFVISQEQKPQIPAA